MPREIYLVKVGMSMTEGMVSEWFVPDGGTVKKGELVYALETEKVNLDVDAEYDGTVKHMVEVGVMLKPGDVVGYIFETGEEIPADGIGEIITRSPCVMSGYLNNESATKNTLKNGWLYTGDMGSIDRYGILTLKDRSKDLIISGGMNIYPREIEDLLIKFPTVREVAVVGFENEKWGEDVVAFVVGTAVKEELDSYCLENLARFKRPKKYVFLESLPKNNYGKILKKTLRDQLSKGEFF